MRDFPLPAREVPGVRRQAGVAALSGPGGPPQPGHPTPPPAAVHQALRLQPPLHKHIPGTHAPPPPPPAFDHTVAT